MRTEDCKLRETCKGAEFCWGENCCMKEVFDNLTKKLL